jgi:hypothetical protein
MKAALALLLASCAAHPIAPAPSTPARSEPDLRAALSSVVLILNHKSPGHVVYGAGLIVGRDGTVLTNLHVVDDVQSLDAMVYRDGRSSYAPMDGGLGRFAFEYQKELVRATVIRKDAATDLALLHIDADTSRTPILRMSATIPAVGDRVYALGHGQETVWSASAGTVSALHHGFIQHDAVVSFGNSGGPLVDGHGDVVGINTARVTSEARGFGFARPIEIASALLPSVPHVALDRSTPERAIKSCWHAEELASPAYFDCVDWDDTIDSYLDRLRQIEPIVHPETAKVVHRLLERKVEILRAVKVAFLAELRGETYVVNEDRTDDEIDAAFESLPNNANSEWLPWTSHEQIGLKDALNPEAVRRLFRVGIRVENIHELANGRAWIQIAGRNRDGSLYRFSECWVRGDGGWRRRFVMRRRELADLPAGWPRAYIRFAIPFDLRIKLSD